MASCISAEFRNEMRVRQEAYVKEQVGLSRYARLITKAQAGDQNVLVCPARHEFSGDVCAQFVDVELGAVYNEICQFTNRFEMLPLFPERRLYCGFFPQWMRTAGLTEAPHQHIVRGLQKQHGGLHLLFE